MVATIMNAAVRMLGRETAGHFEWIPQETAAEINSVYLTPDIERFSVWDKDGKIAIFGNTPSAIFGGLRWYLTQRLGVSPSSLFGGEAFPAVTDFPPVGGRVEKTSPFRYRYALNYCTYSYSMAFWDWARWEKELDRLALDGVNLALSLTGQEEVVRRMLLRLGMTKRQCGEYLTGPAHLAWFFMGNMTSFGGPLPEEWFDDRVALARKIHTRMAELGITPVLQGFYGMVPKALLECQPGLTLRDQGGWCGFERPALLAPEDPRFDEVAAVFYGEQRALFGDITRYFAADPFHEGGNHADYDLRAFGRRIWGHMAEIRPDAVWIVQGWGANPRKAILEGLSPEKVLILDLLAGRSDLEEMTDGFYGYPWIWCPIQNYGGRCGLFGFLRAAGREPFPSGRADQGRRPCGIGTAPEALGTNPVFYEFMGELPFREEALRADEWIVGYVRRRYASTSEGAAAAWKLLEDSVYNSFLPQPGGAEALFCARPGYECRSVSAWGPKTLGYDREFVRRAAWILYEERGLLGGCDAYRYDLADVTRQALSDWSRVQYEKLMYLLAQGAKEEFAACAGRFLEAIIAQDRLLSTRGEFLLGRWLEDAGKLGARYGGTYEGKFRKSAATLLTVWGSRSAAQSLHDYSAREWAGLTGTLYYQRWKLFFSRCLAEDFHLSSGIPAKDWEDGQEPSHAPEEPDWFAMEAAWVESGVCYPTVPQGDTCEAAGDILQRFLTD